MPYQSKAKPKTTRTTKAMKPVDNSKPNGEQQFKIPENNKKKLKKKDIFEMK